MLRQTYKKQVRKDIPVSPLYVGDTKEVQVDVKDALGVVIETRKEQISVSRELTTNELIGQEPADLYSISNLQKMGISPVMCSPSAYIRNGIDNIDALENASAVLSETLSAPKASAVPQDTNDSNTDE